MELRRECLAVMLAGRCVGSVAETANSFIRQRCPHLLKFLPKVKFHFNLFYFFDDMLEFWIWPWFGLSWIFTDNEREEPTQICTKYGFQSCNWFPWPRADWYAESGRTGLHKETFQIFHADCGHCPNSGWLHRLLAYFFGPRVCKDNHESTHAILAKLVKSQAGRKIGCLEKIQFQSTLALALNKAIQSARACIDNRNLECLQADTNRMKIGRRRMYRCDFCTWYGTKCQRWSRTGHFSEGSSSNT